MTTTQRFEVGNTYITAPGGYEWIFEVVARTTKFVTIRDAREWLPEDRRDLRRVGIHEYNGTESCLPLGRYSMAPCLQADRTFEVVR